MPFDIDEMLPKFSWPPSEFGFQFTRMTRRPRVGLISGDANIRKSGPIKTCENQVTASLNSRQPWRLQMGPSNRVLPSQVSGNFLILLTQLNQACYSAHLVVNRGLPNEQSSEICGARDERSIKR